MIDPLHIGVVGLIRGGLIHALVLPAPRVRVLERLLEELVLGLRDGGVGSLHTKVCSRACQSKR